MTELDQEYKDDMIDGLRRSRFECDGCQQSPIKGFRYHCIVCDDYDLCEYCYRSIKSIHHHPFYKLDKEEKDPILVENPLNNKCHLEEQVKEKIENLFQFLCKVDMDYHLLYGVINTEVVSQAQEGLSELKKLFEEVHMNKIQMDNIRILINILQRFESKEENIPKLIKDVNQEFAAILRKIVEAIIRKRLKMRKCFLNVEKNKFCKCGHDWQTHENWKKDETKYTETGVVGNICFKNTATDINMGHLNSIRNKKYFRINSKTSKKLLSEVIDMNWLELPNRHPNLVISVIGDTKHVEKDQEVIKKVKNGLMNAVLFTDAVIVTNGLHNGIAKLVGEAVQEVFYDPDVREDKGIEDGYEPLIVGVTSWMGVRDKRTLISENGEASYNITSKKKRVDDSEYLDCFHNRFILVDDDDEGNTEETSNFRLDFENLLVSDDTEDTDLERSSQRAELYRNDAEDTDSESSSQRAELYRKDTEDTDSESSYRRAELYRKKNMFVVVIGGDEEQTLKQVVQYWDKGIPTLIVKGTGGLADTLHAMWTEETLGNKISEMLRRIKMDKYEDFVVYLLQDRENPELPVITILDPHKLGKKSIEKVVFEKLYANEKRNCDLLINIAFGNTTRKTQSFEKILIKGCTIDVANERWKLIECAMRSKIIQQRMFPNAKDFRKFRKALPKAAFKDENIGALPWLQNVASAYKKDEYFRLLSELTERVYSIKDDEGTDSKRNIYSTEERNSDTDSERNIDSTEERNSDDEDTDSERNIYSTEERNSDFLDKNGRSDSTWDENRWEQLLIEFFLWSLLLNKLDLAKLLCRISRDVLANCIVGYGVLKKLAEQTDNTNLKNSYEVSSREFSNIAVEMLNFYQKRECMKAKEILHAKVLTWGDHTYLDIAMKMKNNDFKDMLDKQWMGELKLKIGVFKCLLCLFCPPLVLCLDLFEDRRNNTIFCHAVSFYSAPFIVYINNVVSYLIFLQLFSYTIITEMNGDFSWVEMLLMVWVFSIFCDEIRQLLTTPSAQPKAFKTKCLDYIRDFWNIIDMVSILLFAAAVVCRYLKSEESLEAARVLYACSLMTFYLRILHMFSINKKMGPTLHMIAGMLHDFALFVGIILILMISYGVASYSISYPNSDFTLDLPWKISRSGFWPVFGNFFLEETEVEEPRCSFNVTIYSTGVVPRCPTAVSRYVNPILLGIYFIIANVLLLNFIISVFSNAMADVSQKSKQKWLEDRCFFIYTYLKSPILAPPFILLSHVKEIIYQIKRQIKPEKEKVDYMAEKWKIFSGFDWWKDSSAHRMLLNRKEQVEDSGKTIKRNLKSMKDDMNNMDKSIKTIRNEVLEQIEKQNEELQKFQKKFDEILEIMKMRFPPNP